MSRATSPLPNIPTFSVQETVVEHDIFINDRTILETLHRYPADTYIEYPESGPNPIGHLFELDPQDWQRPTRDLAYSQGKPAGQLPKSEHIFCSILVDKYGEMVPCTKSYSTCQGLKACPFNDINELTTSPHWTATRADLQQRLREERENRLEVSSPKRDIFKRTAAYISTLRNQGCTRPVLEPTLRSEDEQHEFDQHQDRLSQFRRGYTKPERCLGRIMFHKADKKPYLKCEHYSAQNKDHWTDFTIADGSYDIDYLEAIFSGNNETIHEIGGAARLSDYGPLAQCPVVSNFSSQKLNCPTVHRDEHNKLYQPELVHLECSCRFRCIQPIESSREACPFFLLVVQGAHPHPIPLPEKTPPKVRAEIFKLLENVGEDLPDMTPRAFLRHPTVQAYLKSKFPQNQNPTLSHLHSSLANRSHLNAYIQQAKITHFPKGTDWKGVLHRKQVQDEQIDPSHHYIRTILDLDDDSLTEHEEDEPAIQTNNKRTRIIICMSPEGSRRLLRAQYLQSDIGFKRIVGFLEFELACMDRDANTSVIFCRIYLNRQTAAAHQHIFQEIEALVRKDTGSNLSWRHLHGRHLGDYDGMILHWAADQHRGQAKGLGLHLQALAQALGAKPDLHEPERPLASLSPYEHLYRILRMCVVHVCRRIKSAAVPEDVKKLMRSLICEKHEDWDGTLAQIKVLGGKAGTGADWVNDKIVSRFILQGICHEKSHMPLDVWKAGERNSNLIETVHRDVNREGVHCTLLGGIIKGQRFDALKMKTILNATKILEGEDAKILVHNAKIDVAHKKVYEARVKIYEAHGALDVPGSNRTVLETRIEALQTAELKVRAAYDAQILVGQGLIGTGSGKVQVVLPT
ncbi:hypothetical protein DFH09DRAFT_1263868 [Mycena vulgaris]|nr:hypothetical protein DFH09DRAFT_1263868 [Mycena vulgaris]